MGNEWKILWESCGKDLRWIIKECIQIIHWEQTCIFKAEVCFIRHIYKMIACESLMVFCTNLLHLTGVDINVLKKGKYNIGFWICWFSTNRENMDSYHVYRICLFLYCHCSSLTLHDICLKGIFASLDI